MNDIKFVEDNIKNEAVVEAMRKVREEGTPENMTELLKVAAAATFIVPLNNDNGKFGFHAVQDKKGRKFLVVYVDTLSYETAQVNAGNDFPAVAATFGDLTMTVLAPNVGLDGFILNPGNGEVLFGREMLEMIYEQMGGDEAVKAADKEEGMLNIRIGTPDHFPVNLKNMMNEFARDDQRIKEVYVKLTEDNDTKELRWLLAIKSTETGDTQKYLYETFGRFLRPALDGMGVMAIDVSEPYIQPYIKDEKPFWSID